LLTGLELKLNSPLGQAVRFSAKQPIAAAKKVTTFVQGIVQEMREEENPQGRKNEEGEKHGQLLPPTWEHAPGLPAVVPAQPSTSAKGMITIVAPADGQLVHVAVDRREVEALQRQPTAASRVHISFALNGHQYVTEIAKDQLIGALASR
jgi:pyruvate/2-oxoglutarate/acetoin dehydrogenase E1 component